MSKEIECKYTVNLDKLDMKGHKESRIFEQGYLTDKPWVRIRLVDNKEAFLTIKFNTETALVRDEYEWSIAPAIGRELLARCTGIVRKMRHHIAGSVRGPYGRREVVWEVDQFLGELNGIWTTEIKIRAEEEQPEIPEWVGKEVTGDKRYSQTSFVVYGNPDNYAEGEHPLHKKV